MFGSHLFFLLKMSRVVLGNWIFSLVINHLLISYMINIENVYNNIYLKKYLVCISSVKHGKIISMKKWK